MSLAFETYFKSLAGSWVLKRNISTGESLNGKAVFEPVSDMAFLLREEGELTLLNDAKVHASNNWFWHLGDVSELEISYDQAKLQSYHSLVLEKDKTGWYGNAQHLCGHDIYFGEYRFSNGVFEIKHTIKGPSKDYCVTSFYSK